MPMTKRILAALAATLSIAACGGGSAASSPTPTGGATASAPAAAPAATTVNLKDFSIDPATVSVPAGSSIRVHNAGQSPHNLSIRDGSGKVVAATPDLKPGADATLAISLPAGTYTTFCSVPGHESLGMKGALTVG